MTDHRLEALAGMVARVEGAACWLARMAGRAAVVGGGAGLVLWWALAGRRVGDWWQGTAAAVLVLALCIAPAAWLVNVRFALVELVELPGRLGEVTARRTGFLRGAPRPERPAGGVLGAARSVAGVLRDYGDVAGTWGTLAQMVVPSFWMLTLAAFAAVPVIVVLAALAALVDAIA